MPCGDGVRVATADGRVGDGYRRRRRRTSEPCARCALLSSRSRPSSHPDYYIILLLSVEYYYNGQGFENVFVDESRAHVCRPPIMEQTRTFVNMRITISREIHIYGHLTTHNITHKGNAIHTRSSASKNIPIAYEERTTGKIY